MNKPNENEIEEFIKGCEIGAGGVLFSKVGAGRIKSYLTMEKKDLIEEYLSLYFIVEIYGQSSLRDCQRLDIMECVVTKFWNELEQKVFDKKVKELVEADHSAVLRELRGQ